MISRTVKIVTALLASAVLGACAGTPFAYRSQNEIPPGPGLFSGGAGELVVRTAGEGRARGDEGDPDLESYRALRQARAERSAAYREFLAWLEWQRYREWQAGRSPEPRQGVP